MKKLLCTLLAATAAWADHGTEPGDITSMIWRNPVMTAYLDVDDYTRKKFPRVRQIFQQAVNEYERFKHLSVTIRLLNNTPKKLRGKGGIKDGYNTVSFSKHGIAGFALRYIENMRYQNEFDIIINSRIIEDEHTLQFVMLHELGHIYGLVHPGTGDTVMSRMLVIDRMTGSVNPISTSYINLTKTDVALLHKYEALMSPTKVNKLNSEVNKLVVQYPNTVQEQVTGAGDICGRPTTATTTTTPPRAVHPPAVTWTPPNQPGFTPVQRPPVQRPPVVQRPHVTTNRDRWIGPRPGPRLTTTTTRNSFFREGNSESSSADNDSYDDVTNEEWNFFL